MEREWHKSNTIANVKLVLEFDPAENKMREKQGIKEREGNNTNASEERVRKRKASPSQARLILI